VPTLSVVKRDSLEDISTSQPISSSSLSTTSSENKDLQLKVKELKSEYMKKKSEAEKLRHALKAKEKSKLEEKEELLRKKISSYDSLINQFRNEIEDEAVEKKQPPVLSTSDLEKQQDRKQQQQQQLQRSHIQSKPSLQQPMQVITNKGQDSQSLKSVDTDIKTDTSVDEYDKYDDFEPVSSSQSQQKQIKTQSMVDQQLPREKSSSSSLSKAKSSQEDEKSKSVTLEAKLDKKSIDADEDTKSTVSEISEDLDLALSLSKKQRTTQLAKSKSSSDEESSSSSTDTQILVLNTNRPSSQQEESSIADNDNASVSSLHAVTPTLVPLEPLKDIKVEHLEEELDRNEKEIEEKKINNEQITSGIDEQQEAGFISQQKLNGLLDKKTNEITILNREFSSKQIEQPNAVASVKVPHIDLELGDDDSDIILDFKAKPTSALSAAGEGMLKETSSAKSGEETTRSKVARLNVPYDKNTISRLCELAIDDYYWPRVENGLDVMVANSIDLEELLSIDELKEFFKTSMANESQQQTNRVDIKTPTSKESTSTTKTESEELDEQKEQKEKELSFKLMLFDLIGELLNDLYLERYETPSSVSEFFPSEKKTLKKKYFRLVRLGPARLDACKKLVVHKANELLKLSKPNDDRENDSATPATTSNPKLFVSKWRSTKRLDLVDSILDGEMRQEECEWANYEQEEYEAKLLVSNTIFDMLLKDTIDCFKLNLIKQEERRHYEAANHG
jgi:hypothetical protein